MDITNVRSMELFQRLGIADGLREIGEMVSSKTRHNLSPALGVPGNYSFDVLFSTGLSDGGQLITKWVDVFLLFDLPSPDKWRERIKSENDGSMPREPYQRCSQAVLEAWLKPRIQANLFIESHFGVNFKTLEEMEE
ncbi:hypothetical protein N7488_001841 [Penicillium malachiteum]|nr:hypothetical protein N7488_001841 [Penicillium malachiteum]